MDSKELWKGIAAIAVICIGFFAGILVLRNKSAQSSIATSIDSHKQEPTARLKLVQALNGKWLKTSPTPITATEAAQKQVRNYLERQVYRELELKGKKALDDPETANQLKVLLESRGYQRLVAQKDNSSMLRTARSMMSDAAQNTNFDAESLPHPEQLEHWSPGSPLDLPSSPEFIGFGIEFTMADNKMSILDREGEKIVAYKSRVSVIDDTRIQITPIRASPTVWTITSLSEQELVVTEENTRLVFKKVNSFAQ